MNTLLVKAAWPTTLPTKAPASLQWMPPGKHTVSASGPDGKAIKTTVISTETDAARLDVELQQLLTAAEEGKASRPYIDFDHDGGKAAAIPKHIFWEDGIRLEVEWTSEGKAALEGRVYSYFSPSWLHDEKRNRVAGLPAVGPIGALVNTPAFQSIERLAAAHSPDNTTNMTQINQLLGLAAEAAPEATQAALEAKLGELRTTGEELASAKTELTDVKAKLETAKTALEAQRKARLKAEIDALVEAKRVVKDAADGLLQACLASKDDGAAILAALPEAKAPTKGHPPVKVAGKATGGDDETVFAKYQAIEDPAERARFYAKHKDELLPSD